jgi:cytochrome P450
MQDFSEEIVGDFKRAGRADLSQISMDMAVGVAAQVVGLTDSRRKGMSDRIDRFLQQNPTDFGWPFRQIKSFLRTQFDLLGFYILDVQPTIKARQAAPKENVISYLLSSDYTNVEIMTECITYGAAGMVTTRELIGVAMWHRLKNPELHQLMLNAGQETRYVFCMNYCD